MDWSNFDYWLELGVLPQSCYLQEESRWRIGDEERLINCGEQVGLQQLVLIRRWHRNELQEIKLIEP